MISNNNGTKEAFKRAALYQSCKQSSILSNIDFENTSTDALVDLVNHYNSQSIRELPIILSKMVVKGALTFVTNKYPKVRSYINPENIRVRVEDDEMAHLISTSSKRATNLITLVVKNLAVSTLGSSIEQIRRELLDTNATTAPLNAAKITVEADIPEEMTLIEPPSVYSDFGDGKRDREQEDEPTNKRPKLDDASDDDNDKNDVPEEPSRKEGEDEIKQQAVIDLVSDEDGQIDRDDEDDIIVDDDEEDDNDGVDDNAEEEDDEEEEEEADDGVKDNENITKAVTPPPPLPPSPSPPLSPTLLPSSKPKITDVTVLRPSEMKSGFDFFDLVRSEMPNAKRLTIMSNKYQFDNDD